MTTSKRFGFEYPSLDALLPKIAFNELNAAPPSNY